MKVPCKTTLINHRIQRYLVFIYVLVGAVQKNEKILSQIDFKRKLVRLPIKSSVVMAALVNDILV